MFLCYYEVVEQILAATVALEKMGHSVIHHGLMKEPLEEEANYELFSQRVATVDMIFMWCYSMHHSTLARLKHSHGDILFVFYNWDDPTSWEKNSSIPRISQYIDIAFTSCDKSVNDYLSVGVKEAYYIFTPFSPQITYPLEDKTYICDISMCLTNLYDEHDFPNQLINRRALFQRISKIPGIVFHLYGPEHIGASFPNNYKGFIKYHDLKRIYSGSRINLCTHVEGRYHYVNERVFLITGAGGLLYCDGVAGVKDFFREGEEYLVIQEERLEEQILGILKNYEKYESMKERARLKAWENYTYDHWAEKIMSKAALKV